MHGTNVCAGLEVKPLSFSEALPENLYSKQLDLQHRLGQAEKYTYSEMANKLIYWRHCVHTECDELLEWFFKDELSASDLKEAKMEVVDILHFVFNMGITMGLAPDKVQAVYDSSPVVIDCTPKEQRVRLQVAICSLSEKLSMLIDFFPWKSWKKYEEPITVYSEAVNLIYGQVLAKTYALGYLLDMHDQEIGEYFMAKNKENHARQDRGY